MSPVKEMTTKLSPRKAEMNINKCHLQRPSHIQDNVIIRDQPWLRPSHVQDNVTTRDKPWMSLASMFTEIS